MKKLVKELLNEEVMPQEETSLFEALMDTVQKFEDQGMTEKQIVDEVESFYETMQASYDWYADYDEDEEDE